MIIKTVCVREDQAKWLQEKGRAFNFSQRVREMLDDKINGEGEHGIGS
jgi:hypothetical protein